MDTDLISVASTQLDENEAWNDIDYIENVGNVDEKHTSEETTGSNSLTDRNVSPRSLNSDGRPPSFGQGRNGFLMNSGIGDGFASGGGDSFAFERSPRGRPGGRGGFQGGDWQGSDPWRNQGNNRSSSSFGHVTPDPRQLDDHSGPFRGGSRSSARGGNRSRRARPGMSGFGVYEDHTHFGNSGKFGRNGGDSAKHNVFGGHAHDLDEGPFSKSSPFSQSNHSEDARSSAPLRSLRTPSGAVTYPLIYVSTSGTISVVLADNVVIETAVDRSVRVVCYGQFAAYVNSRGTSSCILHSKARMLHSNEVVQCKFMSTNDRMAVFGPEGVLFTMGHLPEAYLVSSTSNGPTAVPLDQLEFPPLRNDYSLRLFYSEAQTGDQYIDMCKDIVSEATYYRKPIDNTLVMSINGMMIRYSPDGEVSVDARPRLISFHPSTGALHVRSSFIDMGVQSNEKAFVKRGAKRVHVSRSGMVVSDSQSITSMDHFGRVVSCT